jgi:hypothetical protein
MVNESQTAPLLQMVLFMPSLDLLEVKEVSYIQASFSSNIAISHACDDPTLDVNIIVARLFEICNFLSCYKLLK